MAIDELCSDCPNRIISHGKIKIPCKHPCTPMRWIDGNKELKEKILKYPLESHAYSDYNNVLSQLIDGYNTDHIDNIRELPDIRIRAIAAMLYADISLSDISRMLHVNRSNLYRNINKMTHPKTEKP